MIEQVYFVEMKHTPGHKSYDCPQTLNMSESCFSDRDSHLGYVSHNNRTTWSKPAYSQPGESEYKKKSIIGLIVIGCTVVGLIALIWWLIATLIG